MCYMVHRRGCVFFARAREQSETRERTNKSGTCTGNERARRYMRTCSSRAKEETGEARQSVRDGKREQREREREGVSIPGAFAFVNCVCEVPILRGPGNIRFSIAKSSHRGITFSRDIHSLAPSKFLELSSLTNSERKIEERERGREGEVSSVLPRSKFHGRVNSKGTTYAAN